jgi:hypothetical protein
LPTRLLDLTYNPLVGLFFACWEKAKESKDGEFLRFRLRKSRIKYFDSDTVSCIANLSNLTGRERNTIRDFIKLTGQAQDKRFNKSDIGRRFLHFINAEKPYFQPLIKLSDLDGLPLSLEDSNSFEIEVFRAKVPASAKKDLLKELDSININASTLFPEIESAAKYIMSKITPINELDQ